MLDASKVSYPPPVSPWNAKEFYAMTEFTLYDCIALAVYIAMWAAYHFLSERGWNAKLSLNSLMNEQRHLWMQRLMERDNRMVDAALLNGLQSGTAFFASTALLALGGSLSALGATDTAVDLFSTLPFGMSTTKIAFELKIIGLAAVFTYSFFKMAWSYRLFNYASILVGCAPLAGKATEQEMARAAERTAQLHVSAGRHFNRGMRGFFFALAYLGWFAGPFVFLAATLAVVGALFRRQFFSDSRKALL